MPVRLRFDGFGSKLIWVADMIVVFGLRVRELGAGVCAIPCVIARDWQADNAALPELQQKPNEEITKVTGPGAAAF